MRIYYHTKTNNKNKFYKILDTYKKVFYICRTFIGKVNKIWGYSVINIPSVEEGDLGVNPDNSTY